VAKIASDRLIEVQPPQERAVLLIAPDGRLSRQEVRDHLDELASLADTAGAAVVSTVQQHIEAPHPAYFIGTGKVEELRSVVGSHQASLVIFDEDLTPVQGQKLEQALGVRVMDRTELIIDIFALRARTAEAKTQVELAQLQYETDRRTIRRRIRDLKQRLGKIAQQRETERKGRAGEFRAALVGYTNAGKSSILAALSGSELFIEDRLFATLDPATRAVDLGEGFQALVTDTVGFIRKLPHNLVASFRATLEEANEADVLCHVVDVAHPSWEEQYEVVEDVLSDLRFNPKQRLVVFNKVDRLTHDEETAIEERAAALLGAHVFTSTVESGGIEPLRAELSNALRGRWPTMVLTIPASAGDLLAELYREGEVLDREDRGARIQVTVRLPVDILGRFKTHDDVSVFDAPPAA
jgi:GTP-binding protein HflX